MLNQVLLWRSLWRSSVFDEALFTVISWMFGGAYHFVVPVENPEREGRLSPVEVAEGPAASMPC